MKHSEKMLLEKVYTKIFEEDHLTALKILREMLGRKDLSSELKEIIQFKIADILFQDKKYKKASKEFENFLSSYPKSQLCRIASERIDFIRQHIQ